MKMVGDKLNKLLDLKTFKNIKGIFPMKALASGTAVKKAESRKQIMKTWTLCPGETFK